MLVVQIQADRPHKCQLLVILQLLHHFIAQNMRTRHQIVSVIKNTLQNRRNGVPGKAEHSIGTSVWSQCGFNAHTSSQLIESSIFGNNLYSDDLGTCMSCLAHLERMIDQVGPRRPNARALPIPEFDDCYHQTSFSEHFRFARLRVWR